jgi:hypothetical protein
VVKLNIASAKEKTDGPIHKAKTREYFLKMAIPTVCPFFFYESTVFFTKSRNLSSNKVY